MEYVTRADLVEVVEALSEELREIRAERNPAPSAGGESSRIAKLEEELRARDRDTIQALRAELAEIRNNPADPIAEIERARELAEYITPPEPDRSNLEMMGYLSNMAEAYIESRQAPAAEHPETSGHDAAAVQAEHTGPGEPPDPEIHPGDEPGGAPGVSLFVDEGPD